MYYITVAQAKKYNCIQPFHCEVVDCSSESLLITFPSAPSNKSKAFPPNGSEKGPSSMDNNWSGNASERNSCGILKRFAVN